MQFFKMCNFLQGFFKIAFRTCYLKSIQLSAVVRNTYAYPLHISVLSMSYVLTHKHWKILRRNIAVKKIKLYNFLDKSKRKIEKFFLILSRSCPSKIYFTNNWCRFVVNFISIHWKLQTYVAGRKKFLSIYDSKNRFYIFVDNIEIRGIYSLWISWNVWDMPTLFLYIEFLASCKAHLANYRELYTNYYLKVYSICWNVTYCSWLSYYTDHFIPKS